MTEHFPVEEWFGQVRKGEDSTLLRWRKHPLFAPFCQDEWSQEGEVSLLARKAYEEAYDALKYLKTEGEYLDFLCRWAKSEGAPKSILHEIFLTRQQNLEKREEIRKKNPSAHWAHATLQYEAEEDEDLIKTPYVQEALHEIVEGLRRHQPMFLRGHLGTGKTELAVMAAKAYRKESFLDRHLRPQMGAWSQSHPGEDPVLGFLQLRESLMQSLSYETMSPLVIAGNRDLRASDLFWEKELHLKEALEGMEVGEALQKLESLKGELPKELHKDAQELFLLKHSAFGTEVSLVPREVLQAMDEGRVLILDEMNAIGMEHLVSLNDLLQHHVGEEAYVTGYGRVRISEGFGVIATGNLGRDDLYTGTEEMNAAFLSRFHSFEYSYLPQCLEGSLRNGEGENELFRVIVHALADREKDLRLPGGWECLEALYRLCSYAAATQHLFAGLDHLQVFEDHGLDAVLQRSVLSMRHLLRVLARYDYGVECSLDEALWRGFLQSVTDDDDQILLVQLAQQYGFFPVSEGWEIPLRNPGEAPYRLGEIGKNKSPYVRPPEEVIQSFEWMPYVYGKVEEYTDLPEVFQERVSRMDVQEYLSLKEEMDAIGEIFEVEDLMRHE